MLSRYSVSTVTKSFPYFTKLSHTYLFPTPLIRNFSSFRDRAKNNDFSYLEYFDEKERQAGEQLPPMTFSTAKHHKSSQKGKNFEEKTFTFNNEKFEFNSDEQKEEFNGIIKHNFPNRRNDFHATFTTPDGRVQHGTSPDNSFEDDYGSDNSNFSDTKRKVTPFQKIGTNLVFSVVLLNF